jgi:DNA-binding CsgD family transcriptional regulator
MQPRLFYDRDFPYFVNGNELSWFWPEGDISFAKGIRVGPEGRKAIIRIDFIDDYFGPKGRRAIQEAAKLTPREREVDIFASREYSYSLKEIAAICHIKLNTVKRELATGRRKLEEVAPETFKAIFRQYSID